MSTRLNLNNTSNSINDSTTNYGGIIILVVIAIIVIYYLVNNCNKHVTEPFGLFEDKETMNSYLADMAPCSKHCCDQGWPINFMADVNDPIYRKVKEGYYVPSNLSCSGRDSTGCVCLNNKQFDFYTNRGNNIGDY